MCVRSISVSTDPKRAACGDSKPMLNEMEKREKKKKKKRHRQNSLNRQTMHCNNLCTAFPHMFADGGDLQ